MQPRDPRAQHATPGSPARRRCSRRITARVISLATVLAFSFASAVHSAQNEKNAVPERELQAKMAYCENCHGVSGRGFQGYYPIPRLAGQQPEYIKNQLQAFIERRRTNNIMFNVSHVLTPAMLDALTTSFQNLNPKPLVIGAPKELVADGRKIYEEGLPASDAPPCASCHRPEAKGDGQFPRLAG